MLKEMSVESLITRQNNMVIFYNSLIRQIHVLEKLTGAVHNNMYEFHQPTSTHDKNLLIKDCQYLDTISGVICEDKQLMLMKARERNKLTHCPKCKKAVVVSYWFEMPACENCGNEKELTVLPYV